MTTDGAPPQAANGGTNGEDTEEQEPSQQELLAATVWPQVDEALSGITVEPEIGSLDLIVHIPRDEIVRALGALKRHQATACDYLRCLTAVDNEEDGMDVVYHLYSIPTGINVTVKTTLPNDDLNIDTATGVWRAANWLERETAEMFGIRFTGHPDPRTLLMPDEMTDSFPLRKDHPLAEIEVLQGDGLGNVGAIPEPPTPQPATPEPATPEPSTPEQGE